MSDAIRYVRNAWYMAGWHSDFPAGKPTAARILDEPLVFYRQSEGKLVALEDRCPHRLAPLSMGLVEGDDLRCLYHGVKFNGTGDCIEVPGINAKPKALCARAYPVIERESAVFVWMGEAEKADEALMPPFIGPGNPDWQMLPGHMDYDVWYELIQDNLLDLSHLPYVHRNSFGGGNEETNQSWANAQLKILSIPNGVRVERWMPNARTRPSQEAVIGPYNDALTTFDYLLPGYFLLTSYNFTVGAMERAGGERPAEEPLFRTWTSQAVTPRSRRSTTYFFCFGPWSKEPGAERMKEAYRDLALVAFNEDRDILTGQQRVIDADPSRKMVFFDVDRAPILYRRFVEKLLAAEGPR